MKKLFLFISLLLANCLLAQKTTSIAVNWLKSNNYTIEKQSFKIPLFTIENFVFNDVNNTILYSSKFNTYNKVDENSFVIKNIILENITKEELGDLSTNNIPNNINAKIISNKNRDTYTNTVIFSPIIKANDGFKKVKSINFDYNESVFKEINTTENFTTIYNSTLSTGDWYKFYIEKSGVYKISKSFLQQLGMNVNVDPRNIKIYGNGGRMIPLINSIEYPSDLTENAIQFIGEDDGVFNNEDYILFYAEGFDNWNSESETHLNLYETKSYYYVTSNSNASKRILNAVIPTAPSAIIYTSFDNYQFHEKDLNNIGRIGRDWFGEQFDFQNNLKIEFNTPNVKPGTQAEIKVYAASASFTTTSLKIEISGVEQTVNFPQIFNLSYTLYNIANSIFNIPATETTTVNLTYNNNSVPSSKGFLNYITLKTTRNLVGYGKQFIFYNNNAQSLIGVGEYQLTNASTISQIWNVTDIYNVTKIENNGNANFNFKTSLGEIKKFIALDPADYFSPLRESQAKVVNQNLKGTIFQNQQNQFQDVDYLIITPSLLTSEAERLADFHRSYSSLNVKVVTLDKIYNEFSSGKQDIGAIRNFIKYVYNNASNTLNKVKYVNLFGDASFDYKNRIQNNTNIVPIFHSLMSNSLLSSTMSDDFYGMMDLNEGRMFPGENLDIAVGRMLVEDVLQANEMVTKVLEYHDDKSYGRWRNNFMLLSDDVDESWENVIQQQLDNLGNNISAQNPYVNVLKYHADSYVQEASAGGQRYPKLKQDIANIFQQGTLVFNYFGHGGEEQLSSERLFEKADAQNMTNRYRYPLFVTVTCEFTRFDNPFRPTAGEFCYWNKSGGAISMVTTTRLIGVQTGQDINNFFSANLYGFNSAEDISIAEALRRSKNTYSSPTLMVFYIGDPALKLAIPKPKIILTKINDEPAETTSLVFNALSKMKISGEVRDITGNTLLSNYNGEIAVQLFDKKVNRTTLGNDNATQSNVLVTMSFTTLGETIFRGNATVINGKFEFEFVVPKDISIPIGFGRISFYAKSNILNTQDNSGYNNSIQIGGINQNAPVDNIGPTAKLYMNDETFVYGGITNKDPYLLALLEDENGINTASGIGHDIVAILDGDENNPYILNDYYETELNNYTKGRVRFPFKDLAPGLHSIVFRAWDVYNNPISAEIQFIVVGDENIALSNVLNYPNPFVNYTQFWFSHNNPYEPLDVQVQIFTITGKVVKTINQVVNTEGFLSREISWDGKDDFGDKIGKGVYIYKLTVKSTITNKKSEKIEKLVIL